MEVKPGVGGGGTGGLPVLRAEPAGTPRPPISARRCRTRSAKAVGAGAGTCGCGCRCHRHRAPARPPRPGSASLRASRPPPPRPGTPHGLYRNPPPRASPSQHPLQSVSPGHPTLGHPTSEHPPLPRTISRGASPPRPLPFTRPPRYTPLQGIPRPPGFCPKGPGTKGKVAAEGGGGAGCSPLESPGWGWSWKGNYVNDYRRREIKSTAALPRNNFSWLHPLTLFLGCISWCLTREPSITAACFRQGNWGRIG